MRPGETVLQEARRKYDIATESWREQRALGGIAPLDRSIPEDNEELSKGAKYKCTTPAAAMVMGIWQRCNAELNAAAENERRRGGDESCPTCDRPEPMGRPEAVEDSRLPPEREDVGGA